MAHRLVVVSFDSLQTGDLETLASMPNFSGILSEGAVVERVRPIYPTLTYPIHTTMITGVLPKEHGIIHNQIPGLWRTNPDWSLYGSDWFWYRRDIRTDTLPEAAARCGRKVASVLWPVTAGIKEFLNVPPIWPDKRQNPDVLMRETMSEDGYRRFYDRYYSHYNWQTADDMHEYGVEIALEILREDQPDMLFHHVEHLDAARHAFGDHGKAVDDCLRRLDMIAGRYMNTARRAGILEDTNFVFLGDHGQIDIETIFALNRLFVEEGLIWTDGCGQPDDYLAYSFSAGFSSEIFLKNPEDESLYQRVYDFLRKVKASYPQYIERIYNREELLEEGMADEGLCFMVEAVRGTMFSKELSGPLVIQTSDSSYKGYRATHGHHPDKQPQPPFIAFGPDICPGTILEQGSVMEVCPTLAVLAQVDFSQAEGNPFPILNNRKEEHLRLSSRTFINA